MQASLTAWNNLDCWTVSRMTNQEEILVDEICYDCIVWTCERCGCEMVVDIDGLPMIKDGKARNVVEPTFCPECGGEQND